MKKFREIKKNIVCRLDLAAEAAGCVRLTLIDNTHACIENHKGIEEYTQKKVCVKADGLSIAISGRGLVLESFGRENVMISGDIKAIQYENLR